ncbi:MAG: maleylpyruvate isomerase family mycothiol-dependent enzyme [Actinobacteria bacterium]|nr:maleylpyruvate isomerase family mycothiol-dependent enzyme [Actinomycetota bacterium]
MDAVDDLALLRREGDALLAAATDLDAPVEGCPGWDVAELVWHVAALHHFWAAVVADRVTDADEARRLRRSPPPRPERADLSAFAAERLDRLVEVLSATDPATPVWSWTDRRDVGFVRRRMAQETMVHRWDAESVGGRTPQRFEPAAAADGVDEFLEHFTPRRRADRPQLRANVHLHATDTPGEWIVEPGEDGLTVRREHTKGDAAVRGPAGDLLLVLWGRRPLDGLDVLGDRSAAEALVA